MKTTAAMLVLMCLASPSLAQEKGKRPPLLRIQEIVPETAGMGDVVKIVLSQDVPDPEVASVVVRFDARSAQINRAEGNVIEVIVPQGLAKDNRPTVAVDTYKDGEMTVGVPYDQFKVGDSWGERWLIRVLVTGLVLFVLYVLVYNALKRFQPVVTLYQKVFGPSREVQRLQREIETLQRQLFVRDHLAEGQIGPIASLEVPEDLAVACASNDCVLFVGRTLGVTAGLPTWEQFLLRLIDLGERKASPSEKATRWAPLRSQASGGGERELIADLISRWLSRRDLLFELQATYDVTVSPPPAVYSLIGRIPFAGALSVAWDHLLAETWRGRQGLVTLSPTSSELQGSLLRDQHPFILPVCGELPVFAILGTDQLLPTQILFTAHEYRQAVAENEGFSKFLNSISFSKTILFVGASLEAIEEFLSPLRVRPQEGRFHYALIPVGQNNQLQADRFLARFGIKLLYYRPSTPDFPEVTSFLRDLHDQVSQKKLGARQEPRPATLDRVTLSNVGPFADLELDLNANWNVFLGNNGCGKSTLLRAIALGLCGADDRAREAGGKLLKAGATRGHVELKVGNDVYRTDLLRTGDGVRVTCETLTPLQSGAWVVLGFPAMRGVVTRRLSGPTPTTEGLKNPSVKDLLPLLAGVVDGRMDDLKQWLVNVEVRSEGIGQEAEQNRRLRRVVFELLNKMTPGVRCEFDRLDKTTWQIWVQTDDGVVPIDAVSQGTMAAFSWVGTLLQRAYEIHSNVEKPEGQPALVVIDEIDSHMHPEWQQHLVPLLQEAFPKLQVIATTHSPLVVKHLQAEEVIRLSRDEKDQKITAEPLGISFQGWQVDQILSGPGFTLEIMLGKDAAALTEEYANLLGKKGRTSEDEARLKQLSQELHEAIPTTQQTAEGREAYQLIRELLLEQVKEHLSGEDAGVLKETKKLLNQIGGGADQ